MTRIATLSLPALAILGSMMVAAPAQAGGFHGHYRGHHGHHYGHRHGHWYGPRWGYGHRHSDYYKYVGAGLFLGAVAHGVFSQPRVVQTRVVHAAPPRGIIYSRSTPVPRQPTHVPQAPAPIERPDVYLRRDPNGECWLVERSQDGGEIITPQSVDVCG